MKGPYPTKRQADEAPSRGEVVVIFAQSGFASEWSRRKREVSE